MRLWSASYFPKNYSRFHGFKQLWVLINNLSPLQRKQQLWSQKHRQSLKQQQLRAKQPNLRQPPSRKLQRLWKLKLHQQLQSRKQQQLLRRNNKDKNLCFRTQHRLFYHCLRLNSNINKIIVSHQIFRIFSLFIIAIISIIHAFIKTFDC